MKINLLIPAAGESDFFKDSYYPKMLVEVNGKPMVQHIIEEYSSIPNVNYIFVLKDEECRKFHTDNIIRLLTDNNCKIIKVREGTRGALCTSLLAVEYINTDDRLLVVNNDEIRDVDYKQIINQFDKEKADAGLISFNSIHPRWTYLRTENDNVIEVAEKKPISKDAATGFYYFRHGRNFVDAAMNKIRKGTSIDGTYYVSGALNELILRNMIIKHCHIDSDKYHSFYSMEQIKVYEKWVDANEKR